MKILHVNISDTRGGAAIACNRLHQGLLRANVDSQLLVYQAQDPNDPRVHTLYAGFEAFYKKIQLRLSGCLAGFQNDASAFHISSNLFGGALLRRIAAIRPDLVHLHWVGANILPLQALSQIQQPVVWTHHDMWPFCGAEHYSYGTRWQEGYSRQNRDLEASGLDLNRITWARKRRAWKDLSITHIGPSNWIMNCAASSALWQHLDASHFNVIPNGLDLDIFKPKDRSSARKQFGFREDLPILLFGAFSQSSSIKGGDLLLQALEELVRLGKSYQLVTFGQGQVEPPQGMAHFNVGRIQDPTTLAKLYSAADLMLVPSRLESFGQTASEAHACGTPVVCFDASGIRDIVAHRETGYRAKPYSVADFVAGIRWCLDPTGAAQLREQARTRAVAHFDINTVVAQTVEVYQSLLGARG